MTTRFFDVLDVIDKLLAGGPAVASFKSEVLPLLGDEWVKRYFFSQISDPAWLWILNRNGLFDDVPPEGRGTFPSDLFKRLAATAPLEVMEIIAALPDTQNQWIHMDLLETAAVALGGAKSEVVSWTEQEARWIRAQEQLDVFVVEPATRLTAALCPISPDTAYALAEALLDLPDVPAKSQPRLRVESRIDEWHYKDMLERLQRPLTAGCGARALKLFMRLLIQSTGETDATTADQKIHIWRPAVEDAEQNAPNNLLNCLLVAVRDSALQLSESEEVAALDILESDTHRTFHRVALHIRRVEWDLDAEQTVGITTSTPILEELLLRHELLLLVKERFGEFPQRFKDRYFAFVRQLKEPVERLRFLHAVAEHIAGTLKEDYEFLRREPDSHDILDPMEGRSSSFIGLISPISMDEMKKVSVKELVGQLKSWEPGQGLGEATPEGFARELEKFAEQEAPALSARAIEFIGADPTYIRGLIQGFGKAVRDGVEGISWGSLLQLCSQAIQKPWSARQGSGFFDDFDGTWKSARLEIARLIEAGLRQNTTRIPEELLPAAWSVLEELLDDSDPTEEEEAKRLGSTDPATIAINTIRGTAMQALMYYAFRIRERKCGSPPFPPLSKLAPTITEKLELHLDPTEEPSLAVRSVYGKWLPQLYGLDKEWSMRMLDQIFPRQDPRMWEAAWNAYLAFSQVYMDLLPILRPLYEQAVRHIGKHPKGISALGDADERLGGHLLLYYRHRAMRLEDQLLVRFFNAVTDEMRYKALTAAVRGIQNLEGQDLDSAYEQLKRLWEWRADKTKTIDATRERSAFCWWFIKEQFEPTWALEQLALAFKRGAELELENLVLRRLKELVVKYRHEVFQCLDLIVRKSKKHNWGLYDDEVKEILRVILAFDDDSLREGAEDLVHHIGSLGFLSFRELLHG